MTTLWNWYLNTQQGEAHGSVTANDPREAVSRAMTSEVTGDSLVGEFYQVPLSVLDAAPGNADTFFFFKDTGITISVWTKEAEDLFFYELAKATGENETTLRDAGYLDSIAGYLKAGLTVRHVANGHLMTRKVNTVSPRVAE